MSGGTKYDGDKPLIALIPPRALEAEGRVWTFGMKKYAAFNWTKGIVYSRIVSAILRHTLEIMKGNYIDPETGEYHAAAIRCNAGMLIEFMETGRTDLDDLMYSNRDKGGSHGDGEFK